MVVAGVLLGPAGPAVALPTSFTPGDLVVYEVQGNTSSATAVSLVDYSTSGVASGYSVALPTADNAGTATHALTESGTALNDGELTLSADGQSLIATGYDTPPNPGGPSVTGVPSIGRSVALVSPAGSVDTSTALTDSISEGASTAPNNFRSATTATLGGNIYVGSAGGSGITIDGSASATYLDTADKIHEVQVVNGQLYESTTKGIYSVGSGLPTSGTPTVLPLVTASTNSTPSNGPKNFGPDQFALVTLGSGTSPDTLYVADGSNGATAGDPNAVEKYSLVSGSWVETGSIAVPLAVGLVASVSNGTAHIYVTGADSSTSASNTTLYGITDTSGYDGTLSGSPASLADVTSQGVDLKGLAFAPVLANPNQGDTPETPFIVLLPLLAIAGLGGYVAFRRRHILAP